MLSHVDRTWPFFLRKLQMAYSCQIVLTVLLSITSKLTQLLRATQHIFKKNHTKCCQLFFQTHVQSKSTYADWIRILNQTLMHDCISWTIRKIFKMQLRMNIQISKICKYSECAKYAKHARYANILNMQMQIYRTKSTRLILQNQIANPNLQNQI